MKTKYFKLNLNFHKLAKKYDNIYNITESDLSYGVHELSQELDRGNFINSPLTSRDYLDLITKNLGMDEDLSQLIYRVCGNEVYMHETELESIVLYVAKLPYGNEVDTPKLVSINESISIRYMEEVSDLEVYKELKNLVEPYSYKDLFHGDFSPDSTLLDSILTLGKNTTYYDEIDREDDLSINLREFKEYIESYLNESISSKEFMNILNYSDLFRDSVIDLCNHIISDNKNQTKSLIDTAHIIIQLSSGINFNIDLSINTLVNEFNLSKDLILKHQFMNYLNDKINLLTPKTSDIDV